MVIKKYGANRRDQRTEQSDGIVDTDDGDCGCGLCIRRQRDLIAAPNDGTNDLIHHVIDVFFTPADPPTTLNKKKNTVHTNHRPEPIASLPTFVLLQPTVRHQRLSFDVYIRSILVAQVRYVRTCGFTAPATFRAPFFSSMICWATSSATRT